MKEKKRPTLEQLKSLPPELWQLEVAQISVDALAQDDLNLSYEADALMDNPELTPEMVVELREKLRASGSTEQECGTGSTIAKAS